MTTETNTDWRNNSRQQRQTNTQHRAEQRSAAQAVRIETSRREGYRCIGAVQWLERAVVLAVLVVVAVILIVLSGVCVFAIQKMKPDWLRIHAGAGRAISFGIEIGRSDHPPVDPGQPREERRELEAGRDSPRELEAGPEHGSSASPGTADPSNAAALWDRSSQTTRPGHLGKLVRLLGVGRSTRLPALRVGRPTGTTGPGAQYHDI